MTLLLLLCLINKKSYGLEGTGINKRPLREIKRGEKGTGHGHKLGAARTLLLVAAAL